MLLRVLLVLFVGLLGLTMSSSKHAHEERVEDNQDAAIRPTITQLDHNGLPLIPQPTSSLLDPLNYPNVRLFHFPEFRS